tara:strand:- start:549 stop:917 length:369 start_codon:yes stop_codon:yes gene_type:complete
MGGIYVKCEIFGCSVTVYRRLSIGPGTSTALCEKHYTEFKRELMPEEPKQGGEDMVKNNNEVLNVELRGVNDIPRARDLADILKEWHTWYHTYASLVENIGQTEDLYERTTEALKKWGRLDA